MYMLILSVDVPTFLAEIHSCGEGVKCDAKGLQPIHYGSYGHKVLVGSDCSELNVSGVQLGLMMGL